MVYAHACPTAETAPFRTFGFRNFSHNLAIDAPVKEVLFIYELYVTFSGGCLEFFVSHHTVYYFVKFGGA